jgi:hypothetical protein
MPFSAAVSAQPVASPSITVRRFPSPATGTVRYEVSDALGVLSVSEIDAACDSPDLAVYMRTYYREHPRRGLHLLP